MRGRVVVDKPDDYQGWLAAQSTYADVLARGKADVAAGQTAYAVCTACHGPGAEGNQALNAPKLAGLPAWYLERQLHNFKDGVRGGAPGDTIASQMAAIAAPLDDATIRNVVAYVATLPDSPTRSTVAGNADRGASRYTTCRFCHGDSGQGSWSTNAPPLAGMSDWYLERQMQQFRQGHRGRHPQDFHGAQMARMSKLVPEGEATDDLLTYINALPLQDATK
jgi:cytochrome c oxidase subunit 2